MAIMVKLESHLGFEAFGKQNSTCDEDLPMWSLCQESYKLYMDTKIFLGNNLYLALLSCSISLLHEDFEPSLFPIPHPIL